MYEEDKELEKSIVYYEKSAHLFQTEDSNSSANQCRQKVAQFASQLGQYPKAVEIFEDIARKIAPRWRRQLVEIGVKRHLLKAGICQLCMGDVVVSMENSLGRYRELDPNFSGTREYKLLDDLAAAVEEEDVARFTDTVREYDRMTPLDAWETSLLLRAKEALKAKELEEDDHMVEEAATNLTMMKLPPPPPSSSSSPAAAGVSKIFGDDGRLKRTGTLWTASAHIITAVIGSGILSLAWAVAQLGWIAEQDPVSGKRNYTYMEVVRSNLGGIQVKVCRTIQYINLAGIAIGLTIAASVSMVAVQKSNCFHSSHHRDPRKVSSNPYMIMFGVVQILFSQIPNFDRLWWLSVVATLMSFTYSSIGLGLGVGRVVQSGKIRGSLTGITINGSTVTLTEKIWRSFQALGTIAFAFSFSIILIEIQDTIKSPPSEHKTMKKATLLSVAVTTLLYMLCGYFGYAAFGDLSPGNLLTGFGFYNPYWLVDIANIAISVHLVGAYQVCCQPLFAFIEKTAAE
ncbi:OLC1v1013585C1 [Oldenlandia corymbosa var. corymbosa]|uniref:OLC1v1013585C1 n=1 Tax=Oldenlandia corymbosa var. corymbosa TaxID=529605 RepID=A0AAV1E0R2_OLDCO|nr:OLC1v1013585C1 [Oldenlandia corymbosa var. corymbosa]